MNFLFRSVYLLRYSAHSLFGSKVRLISFKVLNGINKINGFRASFTVIFCFQRFKLSILRLFLCSPSLRVEIILPKRCIIYRTYQLQLNVLSYDQSLFSHFQSHVMRT